MSNTSMMTHEEYKVEMYKLLFAFPQLKDITETEKAELTAYFDQIDDICWKTKVAIFEKLHPIYWDLVWGDDDMTIYGIVDICQESAAAIWILNDKKLPEVQWLINNFLDYWVEDPKRLCEPLFTDGSDGKNLHESIGNAGTRCVNKYALHAIKGMKNGK